MSEAKSIDARAAAERLGMELRTLERLRGRGEGPVPWKATDLQNSKVRYEIAELDAWVARRRMRKSVSGLVAEMVERLEMLKALVPEQESASASYFEGGRVSGMQLALDMVREFETPSPRVAVADNTPKLREALGTERGSTDG